VDQCRVNAINPSFLIEERKINAKQFVNSRGLPALGSMLPVKVGRFWSAAIVIEQKLPVILWEFAGSQKIPNSVELRFGEGFTDVGKSDLCGHMNQFRVSRIGSLEFLR
jgi:hypothetical protein